MIDWLIYHLLDIFLIFIFILGCRMWWRNT